jgi:hypothetical protein
LQSSAAIFKHEKKLPFSLTSPATSSCRYYHNEHRLRQLPAFFLDMAWRAGMALSTILRLDSEFAHGEESDRHLK